MTEKPAIRLSQWPRCPRRVQSRSIALVTFLSFGVVSCTSGTTPSGTTPSDSSTTTESSNLQAQVSEADPEELQIVTTFLPMTQFTKAVVGDRGEVTQLIPLGTGPHDYQAKPSEVLLLTQADVLVQNGLEMEVFLDDMIENAENSDLVVIDSSEGIAVISSEDLQAHDDHDYDEDNHEHEDHEDEDVAASVVDSEHSEDHKDEDHKDEDHKDGDVSEAGHPHDHGEFNPHIWLDPKRAIQQVENIRDGLIAVDPAGTAEYTANAAAYIAQLKALDAEIAADLAPYEGQTFVAYHDFAPYFADSYGLKAEFLVDLPEENPSPEDVKKVVDIVEASNLKTLLTEPQAGQQLEALATDLNVKVSSFDPLETGGEGALEPDYYLLIMRQNAENLKSAFTSSTQSWHPILAPDLATHLTATHLTATHLTATHLMATHLMATHLMATHLTTHLAINLAID